MSTNPIQLPDVVLLEHGGRAWRPPEVLAVAVLNGTLQPIWRDVSAREAVRPMLDDEALQTAVNSFRTARDLTAASDFQRWMDGRHVDLDDVADHLERIVAEPGDAHTDPGDWLWGELVCSGRLDRMLWDFARVLGVAAIATVEGWAPVAPGPIDAEAAALLARLGLPSDTLRTLRAATARYADREAEVLTDDHLARLLETRRLDLIRFDVDLVHAADADVAAEVKLCLTVEREPVAELSQRTGLQVEHRSAFTTAFARELQRELLAAVPGSILGPFPDENGLVVASLIRRHLPDPSRPEVRETLIDIARRDAFPGATTGVRWPAWTPRG